MGDKSNKYQSGKQKERRGFFEEMSGKQKESRGDFLKR
jgi:hypothetical protein